MTLPFNLFCEVCSAIMDTGFVESPSDYIRQFYGKEFSELTQVEAEMIVNNLKKGCLYEGDVTKENEPEDTTEKDWLKEEEKNEERIQGV